MFQSLTQNKEAEGQRHTMYMVGSQVWFVGYDHSQHAEDMVEPLALE